MKIGFVMDPLASVNINADTTFALMFAAQERGHEVYKMSMEDLAAEGDECWATMHRAELRREAGNHYDLASAQYEPLHALDCVFMRKDPPFDVPYLHAAHLLELAEEKGCLVLNKPNALRAANEKLYALHFTEFMPDTLVTRNRERIRGFLEDHEGRCIIKPIDGHGGEGIFMLEHDDRNLNALLEVATDHGRKRIICQAYMEAAREGDKRILLLDGEPLGAILRVPSSDEHRGNIHVGGSVKKTELTAADRAICEGVGPRLSEDGLWFVGIDVIGGKLTEVNVTSPTGIQEMSRLDDEDYSGRTIAWIEERVS
ncbi:MAG: glutathione synthase [Myxococcota bacterium]